MWLTRSIFIQISSTKHKFHLKSKTMWRSSLWRTLFQNHRFIWICKFNLGLVHNYWQLQCVPKSFSCLFRLRLKLLHTEFCHFVMEKPAWSNESNSLFCSAPSVTKKPTGRLAQSGYRNAPPLVTKKLMDRISKKNLLSKICMVQYVQYLFLKAWMTQIPMNNYLS